MSKLTLTWFIVIVGSLPSTIDLARSTCVELVDFPLAGVHDMVLEVAILTNPNIPSAERELEAQVSAKVEARLAQLGFTLLKPDLAADTVPVMRYWAEVVHDLRYPGAVIIHTYAAVRADTKVRSPSIGRFRKSVAIWEWGDEGGDVSIIQPGQETSTILEWANDVTEAFAYETKRTASTCHGK